jgi:DNA-binding GntR family transcriptional regulator
MHQIHCARMPFVIATAEEQLPRIELSLDKVQSDEPLVDSVYRALRDAICDGRLVPNQKLPQIPLAQDLGISRTPVRDALQRLAQEGLVRAVSYRGFVVSEFSAREVIDVYQVRLALEPMIVGDAFGKYTRMDLAQLDDICDRTEATDVAAVDELYALNGDFHRALIEPCPNRVAVRMLRQLWQLPSSLRMFHAQAALGTAMKSSVAEHRAILAAIGGGDRDLAIETVADHIRSAQQETIVALGDDH